MSKSSIIKIGGFIGTLAAGAALVGSAVTGTGAYFSDSKDGILTATSGHLTLATDNLNLSFDKLVPGQDKTKNVTYQVGGDTASDVWLVLDKSDPRVGQFTGVKGGSFAGGGLGRFGHVLVSNNGNGLFQSWNLQDAPAGTPAGEKCAVNDDGHGSGTKPTSRDETPPYCGVPDAIKIGSNLQPGQSGTLNVTFGLTGRSTGQGAEVAFVPFKVVATQTGIKPGQANF